MDIIAIGSLEETENENIKNAITQLKIALAAEAMTVGAVFCAVHTKPFDPNGDDTERPPVKAVALISYLNDESAHNMLHGLETVVAAELARIHSTSTDEKETTIH